MRVSHLFRADARPPFSRFNPKVATAAAALGVAVLVGAPARGAVLLYEGFNGYTAGAALDTVTPNANTVGLATGGTGSSYANGSGNNPSSTMAVNGTGLTLGNLQVAGGAANYSTTTAVAQANITSTRSAGNTTLWGSYLVRPAGTNATGSNGFEVRLTASSGSSSTAAYFRSAADSRGSAVSRPSVAYDNAVAGGTEGATALSNNTTYLVISKFTDLGSTDAASASLWALNAAQFDAFEAAGRTEAFLTTPGNVTAAATASKAAGAAFDWNTAGTPVYLELVTQAVSGTVDEIRFGETLAEVTPVPEPTAAAALGGLLLPLALRRRRSPAR